MTRDRSDLDLGGILGAWMNDAAPASIPVVVLTYLASLNRQSRKACSI